LHKRKCNCKLTALQLPDFVQQISHT
jgi:hypothetical protein